jgi:small subunit ribosomal protein S4
MINQECKICRRAGEKLFLKGERCFSSKCALVKKPYPPGIRGKRGHRRAASDYGVQLKEKQKLKAVYNLREGRFAGYVKEAVKKRGENTGRLIIEALELRLDNVVFRLGFSSSRGAARQLVSHGHIIVNERGVNIPSYRLGLKDRVAIRPQSLNKEVFRDLDIALKKYKPPVWLELDKEKKAGEIVGLPTKDMLADININPIIEFYSR